MPQGTSLPRSNGLRADARTQRKPPYAQVLVSGLRHGLSTVKSHVAHQSENIGERDADSEAQDQGRAIGTPIENLAGRPERVVCAGYSVPHSTTQHAQSVGFDVKSNRACLVERTKRRTDLRTVVLSHVFRLRATLRQQQVFLWKVWREADELHRISHYLRTRQISLGTFSVFPKPPLFCLAQAGCDDGFSSQPERTATEVPTDNADEYAQRLDTDQVQQRESGSSREAVVPDSAAHRGVIDHVSKETSVAYDFGWTHKMKRCEICGRKIHIWIRFPNRFGQHRFCRAHLSPAQKAAFNRWLVRQW